jgi:hypothetical protein
MPPVKPMLAKACDLEDPELLKWIAQESVGFEPKWDALGKHRSARLMGASYTQTVL